MGLKVHNVSLAQAMDEVDRLVKSGGAHLVVTLGVEMVMRAEKDRDFFHIVNDASLVVPDSVGILWGCSKLGHKLQERVPGVDLFYESARNREKYPWRIFLLGAKPGVAEKAAEIMKKDYPGYNVVGAHHGYFKEDEEVIDKITSANPDVLFVAMGSPAQEKWFVKHRERLGNVVALGVGGSLDVVAGNVKRAPVFFQKTGLEWFHRLITQPHRAGRMIALPAFVVKVLTKRQAGQGESE